VILITILFYRNLNIDRVFFSCLDIIAVEQLLIDCGAVEEELRIPHQQSDSADEDSDDDDNDRRDRTRNIRSGDRNLRR
jgi:hypothetical protein